MKGTIAGVLEVVHAFLGFECVEEAGNCVPEIVEGAAGGLAERGFELGEGLLYGVEVR